MTRVRVANKFIVLGLVLVWVLLPSFLARLLLLLLFGRHIIDAALALIPKHCSIYCTLCWMVIVRRCQNLISIKCRIRANFGNCRCLTCVCWRCHQFVRNIDWIDGCDTLAIHVIPISDCISWHRNAIGSCSHFNRVDLDEFARSSRSSEIHRLICFVLFLFVRCFVGQKWICFGWLTTTTRILMIFYDFYQRTLIPSSRH